MATSFPAIPTAGPSLPQLLATVQALTQAVNLLVVNAGQSTSQNVTQQAQTFVHPATALVALSGAQYQTSQQVVTINSGLANTNIAVGNLQTEQASANTSITTLNSSITTLNGEMATANTELATLNSGIGFVGTVAGSTLTVTGAETLNGVTSYALSIPGAVLAANAATLEAGNVTVTTPATITFTLAQTGNVLCILSYVGSGVATPAGSGNLIVKVDGTDHSVIPLMSSGGDVLPATGFYLASGLVAGSHTITGRAEFSTGPTDLNGVSLAIIASMR